MTGFFRKSIENMFVNDSDFVFAKINKNNFHILP